MYIHVQLLEAVQWDTYICLLASIAVLSQAKIIRCLDRIWTMATCVAMWEIRIKTVILSMDYCVLCTCYRWSCYIWNTSQLSIYYIHVYAHWYEGAISSAKRHVKDCIPVNRYDSIVRTSHWSHMNTNYTLTLLICTGYIIIHVVHSAGEEKLVMST